ncbi:AbrB/MazE/SpoVT family DNA-binding domain-containing protein [Sulfurisphaera javensis]|uniref:AbrB/MazE/SpoVT family DNA-binding domain-containing protein n=1 Tax=Sulfurisphaera javensis TaxID=2049879 RepID=A0AAT9GVI3_9CREN
MERVKVTRNYQVTIPASIREKINIKEGDILEVTVSGNEIIMRKVESKRPRIKLNRELTIEDIEKDIEEGMNESSS